MDRIVEILIAVLGGGTIVKLLEVFFARKDKKDELWQCINDLKISISNIKCEIDEIKLSGYRSELLICMNHHEHDTKEIMQLAEKYFTSGGDFYMTSIFSQFLQDHKLQKPLWFDESK